eukprot:7709678-Ditylum_brightwellii.AAC.1
MECMNNNEQWSGLEGNLCPIFDGYGIDPVLQILICTGVNNQGITDVQNNNPNINWTNYKRLIKQQTGIGWKQI